MPSSKVLLFTALKYTSIGFVISFAVGIAAHLTSSAIGINVGADLINTLNLFSGGTWLMLAFSCVAEELGFRGFLSAGKGGITMTIALQSYAIISHMAGGLVTDYSQVHKVVLSIIAAIIILVAAYVLVEKFYMKIRIFVLNYYTILFWISCVAFAGAHSLNYEKHHEIFDYVLLLLPQFVMGALLGYVRIKFDIITSIAVHFLLDTSLFMLMMIKSIHFEAAVITIAVLAIVMLISGIFYASKEASKIIAGIAKPRALWEKNMSNYALSAACDASVS